ncbi:6647_t:CDS:10 [Funneliformis geosporum]|nr:6647_t:CDS:10 [Funneliformis geosporum]
MPKSSKNNRSIEYDPKKVNEVINKYVLMLRQQDMKFPNELPLEELLKPCKTPLNEFFLYRKDKLRLIKRDHPKANYEEVSHFASEKWKIESIETKNSFTMLSKIGILIKDDIMKSENYSTNEGGSSSVENEPWKFSAIIPQMVLCPTITNEEHTLDLKWTGISSMNKDLTSTQLKSEKIMDKFLTNFDTFDFNTEDNQGTNLLNYDQFNELITKIELVVQKKTLELHQKWLDCWLHLPLTDINTEGINDFGLSEALKDLDFKTEFLQFINDIYEFVKYRIWYNVIHQQQVEDLVEFRAKKRQQALNETTSLYNQNFNESDVNKDKDLESKHIIWEIIRMKIIIIICISDFCTITAMFYGHYSCAWIIKVSEPKIPLWVLMIAVQFVDFLFSLFILIEIEEAHIVRGFTKVNDLKLVSIPYTHSLIAVIGWSILYGLWYRFSGYDGGNRAAFLVGLAVLSHWFEDLLVHNEDLLLLTIDDNAPKYGFKLWDYPEIHHPLELLLYFGSFYYYLVNTEVHPSKIYSSQTKPTLNLTNNTYPYARLQSYWVSKWGSIILSVDSLLTISGGFVPPPENYMDLICTFEIVISIFLLFINPLIIHSYKTFSYNETEPGYQINQILTYREGTSVVYLTKPINKTCNEPRIDLRVIHPNGTVDVIEVNYPIPDFNFCIIPDDSSLHIALFPYMPDYIYVLYENSTDISSASYYVLLITRTGKIISNSFLSRVSVINGALNSSGYIFPHLNENNGFLFFDYLPTVKWIYFSKPDSDGNVQPINNGHIDQELSDIFPAIDGNFGIVHKNIPNKPVNTEKNNEPHDLIDPTKPTFELYITFVGPNNNIDGPYLLYQTTLPNLQVQPICNSAYATKGYFCILNIKDELKNYLIKISFQNTGSIIDIENFPDLELYKGLSEYPIFDNLYNGGFIIIIFNRSEGSIYKTIIQSIILDNYGNYNGTLDFPENLIVSASGGFQNGTYFVVPQVDKHTWKIYSIDSPKFVINVPGNSPFIYSADNKTIILDVLESTFNQPNAKYYIVINDNVVKDWETKQPLIGIGSNIWTFNTTDNQDIFAEDATGRFSLTIEGTKYFKSLSSYNQTIFLSQLRIDLANSIPVNINRLNAIKYEYDESQQSPKILLTLPIKSTANPNERNVERILKDLDLLIKYKEITPISWFGTTNFIDSKFGFQQTKIFIDDAKFPLVAAFFTILAGADLEVLSVLSSEVAGILAFSAPTTKKTQSYIFWGGLLGFLIEDIPQFIIQNCLIKLIYLALRAGGGQ